MKYIVAFVAVLLLILGIAYGVLFTAPGNGVLKPVIESKIAQNVPLPTKLERFVLRPDRFDILLKIGDGTAIEAKGTMNLFSRYIDALYSVDIKELSSLEKLLGTRLNGPFRTEGTVKGDERLLKIVGKSDVAASETAYGIDLEKFEPANLTAKIAHLQIDRLLYMINLPQYAKGRVDIDAEISNLDLDNLDGSVVTRIRDGVVVPQPVKRDFNLSIPSDLTFKGDVDTKLTESRAVSKVDFITSVATLTTEALTYDIKKGALSTDYRADVPDLDRLFFLTGQHMKGGIVVTGDVTTSKEKVRATAHSDTLGGAVDALFENGKAAVKIRNIQTVALTDMLMYPHIFDSRANMKLDYDTVKQLGTLHAELLNGQILPNRMSFILQQMANFDITKEVYERTTIDTKIVKKRLISDLYMKSRLTEIVSKRGVIDLDNGTIDTTLEIKIRKAMIPVTLKGELTSPQIKVDAKEVLRSKAKEEIEKRLPKNLKESPAGELLKGLF
ncbi:hypothetical protein NNO_1602 [Hydrogenimonas sp.]|nr:hypothetical protein NNO_1602 [Hydrogenimonas sp.]